MARVRIIAKLAAAATATGILIRVAARAHAREGQLAALAEGRSASHLSPLSLYPPPPPPRALPPAPPRVLPPGFGPSE